MNKTHIAQACEGSGIKLSHAEWYELYLAAGKYLP